MKDSVTITLVQLTDTGDADSVIARMPAFFEQAADLGSDLVAFPEYVLGQHIGVDHPRVRRFFDLARRHHLYAVAGLVEAHGERWATTALLVDRQGELLGRYFKTHPASGPAPHYWPPIAGHDQEARGILGNQFKVFHLDFGTLGILECYDGYFPEAWGCTSYNGAEVVLWINGRDGIVEDFYCLSAASAYGCAVAANITNGRNTGFATPWGQAIEPLGAHVADVREEMRLHPRLPEPGDACVTARIQLDKLRWLRKHLRTLHQRRPELYHRLVEDVRIWQDYPDIPWDYPECYDLANKSQL